MNVSSEKIVIEKKKDGPWCVTIKKLNLYAEIESEKDLAEFLGWVAPTVF